MTIYQEIAAERLEQMNKHGYTVEHDDAHDAGELCGAGAAYALHVSAEIHPFGDSYDADDIPPGWCWEESAWKPKTPRENLIKAAALIVAEIEKMDRAANS